MAYLFQPLAEFCCPSALAAPVRSARLRTRGCQRDLQLLFLDKLSIFHLQSCLPVGSPGSQVLPRTAELPRAAPCTGNDPRYRITPFSLFF